MTILLIHNTTKIRAQEVLLQVIELFVSAGVCMLVTDTQKIPTRLRECVQCVPMQKALQQCDIVLTIGGDGTMLHAARTMMKAPKPLLGINTGRLGFLTIVESDELEKLLRLPAGAYSVEYRSVLQVDCALDKQYTDHALNDIVLFKEFPEKTIALDIYCDDILVSSFRGDGVVFSTPTGSTAYSMSAGGSIIDARTAGFIVTPICPHIVFTPPMVFAADRVLKVVSRGTPEERVLLGCDGVKNRPLPPGEPVFIRQSDRTVPLVEFSDAGQLNSIDKKLKGR